ncbi:restriction endonuclease subunit S [Geobacillus stearothermophilus]|uniref:restriction endonuclease subunit S n=1 Tax=Geobacillus stearothermophilus TaxID=1422 RepID=UPI002402785E|nr:restriction endonuclease subunit S [Geobacillus stearothermophilus]MDF9296410.1 restriction endonuclease subunit S [Geobacillus stearothermophilus]
MSKAKPKSMEQLLEEALVPKDEQPYEVPGNWVWVKLGAIFEQEKEQIQPTGVEKYIGLEHLLSGGGIAEIGNTQGVKSKKVIFKKGDVLYGKLRPYLNKHTMVDFEGVASTDILVFRSPYLVLNKLLDIFLGLPYVIRYANENSNGINLPRVSPKAMLNLPFPLPPVPEQKRIADKIERLFAKIDEAKRLIEEVKESIERRRAVILEKAFKGQLGTNDPSEKSILETSDDLSEKDVIPKEQWPYEVPGNWVWVKFGVVAKLFNGYAFKSTDYSDEGIPIIRISDLNGMETTPETAVRVPRELYNEKFLVRKGDLLIAMSGATTGKIGIYNSDEIAMQNQRVGNIKTINDNILYAAYRNYFVISSSTEISKLAYGGAQPNISGALIESLPFPLPPLNEQKRIAEKLDNLLEKLENEKQLVLAVEEKLDLLKQSVLQKAFRGELGTNDPNDGHAMELVKEALLSSSGQR